MGNTIGQIVTVLTAIIGVAILAVLVSRKAQTPQVITAFTSGFSDMLRAAASPLDGANTMNIGGGLGSLSNF